MDVFKIRLTNFKCYTERVFEFKKGVTLLHGNSGSGKSTIFQGIIWCLYGSLKNIKPRGSKRCSTIVVIEVGNFIIGRRSTPKELILQYVERCDGVVNVIQQLFGDEAQEYITNHFGNELYFRTSSYIEQGERCLLLDGKSTEKVELLNSVVYGHPKGTQSEYFSNELKTKIQMSEMYLSQQIGTYNRVYSETNKLLERHNLVEGDKLTVEEIRKITDENARIEKERKTLETDKALLAVYVERLAVKKKELLSLEEQLSKYDANDIEYATYDNIEDINQSIDELIELMKRLDKNKEREFTKRTKEAKLNAIRSKIHGDVTEYSLNDIATTEAKERKILTMKSTFASTEHIEYTKENISNRSVIYHKYISCGHNLTTYNEYRKYTKPVEYVSEIEVDEEQEKLSHMRVGCKVLHCPHCDGLVKITSKGLEKGDDESQYTKQDIDLQRIKVNSMQQLLKDYKRYVECKKSYEEIVCPEIEWLALQHNLPHSVNDATRKLSILLGITYEEMPKPSSDVMKLHHTYVEKKKEFDNLEGLEKIDANIDEIRISVENKKHRIDMCKRVSKLLEHKKHLVADIKEIELSLPKDPTSDIAILTDKMLKNRYRVERATIYSRYEELLGEMIQIRNIIDYYNKKILLYRELSVLVSRAENMIYEDALSSINNMLNKISKEIFEEPVSIEIEFLRKEKFSIKISLKGYEYDRVGLLSGGEADRISFALAIVMNVLHCNSPFLFIDESISSLDINGKEMCLKMLRNYINEYVIVVNHDAVEGVFDDVIVLE